MVIKNRDLAAGTLLAARYKGQRYECLVLENEERAAYSLEDGSVHKSLSAAASQLMAGASVNGWRFWCLAEELDAQSTKSASGAVGPTKAAAKVVRVIKRVPNQKGVPEGSTKWWCSVCMSGFVVPGSEIPEHCPDGHDREAAEEIEVDKSTAS